MGGSVRQVVDSVLRHRAYRVAFENLTSIAAKRFYWWVGALVLVLVGLYHENYGPLMVFSVTIGLAAMVVVMEFLVEYVTTTPSERRRERKAQARRKQRVAEPVFTGIANWVFVRGPMALMVLASFVLVHTNLGVLTKPKRYLMVGSTTAEADLLGAEKVDATVFAPLISIVVPYKEEQTFAVQCVAETIDHTTVRADIRAELVIYEAALKRAYPRVKSEAQMAALAKAIICRHFARVVQNYMLPALPPPVLMEQECAIDASEFRAIGLTYAPEGAIAIDKLHVLVAASKR